MSTALRAGHETLWHWLKPDPHAVDFWLARVNRLWSTWEPRARVVGRVAEAENATTLVLRPNRHFKGFRAGQHFNVSVEIDGIRHTRSYSASDAPRRDGLLQITVSAVEGGKISRYLQHVPVGAVFPIGQAFGDFELPGGDNACLLLAAGSGITPMLSLLKAQAAYRFPRPVTLAYWARTRSEWIQAQTLHEWAGRFANFKLRLITTGDGEAKDGELSGRLSAAQRAACLPESGRAHVLACGPGGFVARARELMEGFALSFQAEAFSPPVSAAVTDTTDTVQITLQNAGRVLQVPRGQSLLQALEAQGVSPAHGCRMGICNTCACGKARGATRDLHTGLLDEEPTHALRLCINSAQSDLILEL